MIFYLGTDRSSWLGRVTVPLFVSRPTMLGLRRSPARDAGRWALDSGGYSEVTMRGRWTVGAEAYAREVAGWSSALGPPDFVACQDWMCEDKALSMTGLDVAGHQERTVASYLELTALAPTSPWLPVLQGRHPRDYLRHADAYGRAGVDLAALPLVGLGSVCRRQATGGVEGLIRELASWGVRLHAFGMKTTGLRRCADALASADSMSWSRGARIRKVRLPGCAHRAATCSHCPAWALEWRRRVLAGLSRPRPPGLFPAAAGP